MEPWNRPWRIEPWQEDWSSSGTKGNAWPCDTPSGTTVAWITSHTDISSLESKLHLQNLALTICQSPSHHTWRHAVYCLLYDDDYTGFCFKYGHHKQTVHSPKNWQASEISWFRAKREEKQDNNKVYLHLSQTFQLSWKHMREIHSSVSAPQINFEVISKSLWVLTEEQAEVPEKDQHMMRH